LKIRLLLMVLIALFLLMPGSWAADSKGTTTHGGNMAIQGQDPKTGETINIQLNSNELSYDPTTKVYTATGDVYIIIPEKNMEILAEKATFDNKGSNMVATGNVFIMHNKNVFGSKQVHYDLNSKISYYDYFKTVTKDIRVESKTAERTDTYSILHEGRLIIDADAMTKASAKFRRNGISLGDGAYYSYYSASRIKELYGQYYSPFMQDMDNYTLEQLGLTKKNNETTLLTKDNDVVDKPISPSDVASANFEAKGSTYLMKVNKVSLYRKADGYDEIVFDSSKVEDNHVPLLYSPYLKFGYHQNPTFLDYLGPDIGYSLDYGGFYAGPSFSTRLFDGWLRFSPIATYGPGTRIEGNQPVEVSTRPGVGVDFDYRSYWNRTDFGYTTTSEEPVFYSEQQLFGEHDTRLRMALNHYYGDGFFGVVRPRYIAEVSDSRTFRPIDEVLLKTYISAGEAEDNFFPTLQKSYFVAPTSLSPIRTGRMQLQTQWQPTFHLMDFGKFGYLSAVAQTKLAFYGTGNVLFQSLAGPYASIQAGPFFSQTSYMYSQVDGRSPFVFDTYYLGRNSLQTINSIDIGHSFNVGAMDSFSLSRDNAKNALLVGERFFISTGNKSVRFSIGYDIILRRVSFGITLNPEGGQAMLDFNTMNIYQPGYIPLPRNASKPAS
jgi:lipopolysaccharide export system protein LptA